MFHSMFHHCHRRHHHLLHILAWFGAFLLGWELGKQGFNLPNFKVRDGFIDYPNQEHKNTTSQATFSNSNLSAAETSGPSEQPL